MSEEESNQLQDLVRKYTDDGVMAHAIEKAEEKQFEVMTTLYPEGVNPLVMVTASAVGNEAVTKFLVSIVMEVAGAVHGWTKEEAEEQITIAYQASSLLRTDATIMVLEGLAKERNNE